jgi:hypothetical protein
LNLFIGWGIFAFGPADWAYFSNPFWLAWSPAIAPGSVALADAWRFLIGSLIIASVITALSIWRIRPAHAAEGDRRSRAQKRGWRAWAWFPGPSLDGNPVLWRAWRGRQPSRWLRAIGWLYGLGSAAFSVLVIAITASGRVRSGNELGGVFNGLQAGAGLLLLSVVPAASLSEERVRHSLEILLLTPLTARQIVSGHWRANFRLVCALAILPGLVATATSGGNPFRVLAVVGLVLAFGAALTSLGLALAARLPRPGQATVASVVLYTLVTVGWVFAVAVLVHGDVFAPGLAMGSPPVGVFVASLLSHVPPGFVAAIVFALFWIVVYSVLAILLGRSAVSALEGMRGPFGKPAGNPLQPVATDGSNGLRAGRPTLAAPATDSGSKTPSTATAPATDGASCAPPPR